jgi:hypothetical protein
VGLARRLILPCTVGVSKPFMPRSTRKPRIDSWRPPSSTLAHTTREVAMGELVIHILVPVSTQPSPSRRARVFMLPGSLPLSGSVRPKQPTISPVAIWGRKRCFCSSLPYLASGHMTSEPCTLAKLRRPLSPYSSSCSASP